MSATDPQLPSVSGAGRPDAGSVLQFLGPSTGGIRVHVGELARRLGDRGWRVEVAGPHGVMDGVGAQTADVDVPTSWHPLGILRARRRLLPLVTGTAAPSVVHVHGLKAALVALTIRRGRRPPLVLTIHNLVAGTQQGIARRVLSSVERAIVRRVDHVIVISPEIGERVERLQPAERRHDVLPVSPQRHPTVSEREVRDTYGIDHDAPLVVIVARHHTQKDLPMFLAAMAQIHRQLPTVRAVMVGDGPERKAVEAERHRLGLDDVVVIAGHRPNPIDEMRAADVVALSSIWEGSPLAVAECLSIGAPLVSTAVGTVTRHLTDGESARIVPVGDATAFAGALAELLGSPERRAAIGAAGREVAARTFDPDALTDAVVAVYRAAVEVGSRRR
jgi:glycosyltransferase involved in cell wall biosynthesis